MSPPVGVDQHPDTVELGLVQPVAAPRRRIGQGREHRRDPSRLGPVAEPRVGRPGQSLEPPAHPALAAPTSLGEILPRLQHARPCVALRVKPVRHRVQGEVGRVHRLELVPRERHRHRRGRMAPRRVRRRQRLAAAVLVVVEEDLAGPPPDRPLHGHVPGPLPLHVPRDRLGHPARGVEVEVAHDRQVEVQAGPARGLDEGGEAEPAEDVADPEGEPARAA